MARTVHVFSYIPSLSRIVQEKLSNVRVINVEFNGVAGKYEKHVTKKEVGALQNAEILLVDSNLLAQVGFCVLLSELYNCSSTHLDKYIIQITQMMDKLPKVQWAQGTWAIVEALIAQCKDKMMDKLPKLQWAQGTWAGVEALVAQCKDKPKPSYLVSRLVNESFSQLLAEYTLGWIITHERHWLECRQNQLASMWVHEGKIAYYRSLREITVGILGMGNIGKEVARSLKALNATVHAFTRTAPTLENQSNDVDQYRHTGELPLFLQDCDYIVNIMPSTPDTRGMLGNDVLEHAKKDAVFINIGRGDVITEEALIRALDAEWLSAAILDVYKEEPLPTDSQLWKHPKVVITPHAAGVSRAVDVAQAFTSNYQCFTSGQPIHHMINWDAGY